MANMTPEQREAFRAEMQAKMAQMTPEQRAAFRDDIRSPMASMNKEEREAFRADMKAKMDNMTPEERATMKAEHMEHRAEHRNRKPSALKCGQSVAKQWNVLPGLSVPASKISGPGN